MNSGQIPAMNPLDEAAKDSSMHTPSMPSARDDYAAAAPLQVVVDTQEGAAAPQEPLLPAPPPPPPPLPLFAAFKAL